VNILEVENLHVFIGTFHVIQGISFNLPADENVALLGRNGAGKTTTLKSIIGMIPARKGSIRYMGRETVGLPSYQIARMGIGYIPDTRRIFSNLTVEENLALAMINEEKSKEERLEMVYELFPDLRRLKNQKGKTLSGGQQQMLNIGRGIVSSKNRLLLIDEPTEGLSPLFVKNVTDAFIRMKEQKISMLLVEGRLSLVKQVAERYVIMSQGKIVKTGKMDELLENRELVKEHLGVTSLR
jgi:branched-chain amino acid transport system ATP-binding protein